MSAQADLERAARIEKLLKDPDLAEAFASVRAGIVERIEQCPARDTEGAEKLRMMLRLLRDVRANLDSALVDGRVAEIKLAQERESATRRIGRLFR